MFKTNSNILKNMVKNIEIYCILPFLINRITQAITQNLPLKTSIPLVANNPYSV